MKKVKFAMIPFVNRNVGAEDQSTRYQPALPVKLKSEQFILERYALIDTGADISLIDRKIIEKEASSYLATRLLVKSAGVAPEYVAHYSFDLDVCSPEFKVLRTFKEVNFLAVELPPGCDIVLGRQGVLENLRLTVDYPNRQVEIEFPIRESAKQEPPYLAEAKSLINSGNYRAGVGTLSNIIESQLLKMSESLFVGIHPRENLTLAGLSECLSKENLLDEETTRLILEFTKLRNMAVHGMKPLSVSDAKRALILVRKIMPLLHKKTNEQPNSLADSKIITVSENDLAIEYLDNIINTSDKQKKKFFIKAMMCKDRGLYSEASHYLIKALDIGTSGSEKVALLILLGTTYMRNGEIDKSINLYKKAADEASISKDNLGLVAALGNLGIAEKSAGRFDSAQRNLEMAIALSEQIGFGNGKINFLKNLAEVNLGLGRKEVANKYLQIIDKLLSRLNENDSNIIGHHNRVAKMSEAIAVQLGIPNKEASIIRKAALIHDLGLTMISDQILLKSEKLTKSEIDAIKSHPTAMSNLLDVSGESNEVVAIIKSHHERYDGKGYPDGLKGNDIPVGARIIAIADSYDAMVSVRPYRLPLNNIEIKKELIRFSGSQFDPEIVDAFLKSYFP
jgi:HD-GYP domain-containing protein (c-di-GMP phosphodiesterase class II)